MISFAVAFVALTLLFAYAIIYKSPTSATKHTNNDSGNTNNVINGSNRQLDVSLGTPTVTTLLVQDSGNGQTTATTTAAAADARCTTLSCDDVTLPDKISADEHGPMEGNEPSHDEFSTLSPVSVDELTERRFARFWEQLGKQVYSTWERFYGDAYEEPLSLRCWISPIRLVHQNGPNCGLAVLAMAARPVMNFEVAVDGATYNVSENYNRMKNIEDINNAVEKALLQNINKDWTKFVDPNCLLEIISPPTLKKLQLDAILSGYSNHGEMFSALAMTELGNRYQSSRYKVRLVHRDLLNDPTPTNSEFNFLKNAHTQRSLDDEEDVPPFIKHMTNHSEQLIIHPNDPSFKMDVVQLLIRGHLIAVCFDCDKNMMPSWVSGGSKAHWALLCGVIVGEPYRSQKESQKSSLSVTTNHTFQTPSISNYEKIENTTSDCDTTDNCQESDYCACKFGNLKLDMKQNIDCLWVIARHGKSGDNYAIWSLKELVNSNRQLKKPCDRITQTITSDNQSKCERCDADVVDPKKKQSNILHTELGLRDVEHGESTVQLVTESNACELVTTRAEPSPVLLPQSAPPPPPPLPLSIPPPPPPPQSKPAMDDNDKRPFILPEGGNLQKCLARRYISFEPIRLPKIVSNNIKCPAFKSISDPLAPVSCYFSFKRKQH